MTIRHPVYWVLGLLIVVGLALLPVVFLKLDADFPVRKLAEITTKLTGSPLKLQATPRLAFFPPGIRFGEASWSGIQNNQAIAIALKGGMVQLKLLPLLTGNVVVQAVRLNSPEVTIREEHSKAAVPSSSTTTSVAMPAITPDVKSAAVQDAAPVQNAAGQKAQADDASFALPLELGRMVLNRGMLHYTDTHGQNIRLQDINLSVENLRLGQEAVAECDFAFAVREAASSKVNKPASETSGTLAFSTRLRYAPPVLSFRRTSLTLNPLTGVLPKKSGPIQVTVEGSFDLRTAVLQLHDLLLAMADAEARGQVEATLATPPRVQGDVALHGSVRKLAALGGSTDIPSAIADSFEAKARLEYASDTLQVKNVQATLGKTSITGDFHLAFPAGKPMAIKAALHTGVLDLGKADTTRQGRASAAAPSAMSKNTPKEASKATPQSGAGAAASKPATKISAGPATTTLPKLDVRAKVDGIRHGALLIKDIAFAVTGEKGDYTLSSFACALNTGGAITATGSMRLPAKSCTLKPTAEAVQLKPLLEALGQKNAISGTASGKASLSMLCTDANAVKRSLSGQGLLEIRQIKLASAPKLPQGALGLSNEPVLPDRLDLVRAPFTANNGTLRIQPLTVTGPGLKASGAITVNLPSEALDGKADVATMGMQIPLLVGGTVSSPSWSIDPRFALDMARRLNSLPNAVEKGVSVPKNAGGLLRGILGR